MGMVDCRERQKEKVKCRREGGAVLKLFHGNGQCRSSVQ